MSAFRFLNGHQSLDNRYYLPNLVPTRLEFTLIKDTFPIAHCTLSPKFIVHELRKYYRELEYSFGYYAIIRNGCKPAQARGRVKLWMLDDLLPRVLWSKRHLVWFRDQTVESNYRMRPHPMCVDTQKVIERLFK